MGHFQGCVVTVVLPSSLFHERAIVKILYIILKAWAIIFRLPETFSSSCAVALVHSILSFYCTLPAASWGNSLLLIQFSDLM